MYVPPFTESTEAINMIAEISALMERYAIRMEQNVGTNVGINVGTNERKILTLISNTPKVSMKDMAEVIGTTQRQCERIVAKMKADGLTRRVGATKNGHWERL